VSVGGVVEEWKGGRVMNKMILTVMMVVAGAVALAADTYVDPNPYASYGPAMQSTKEKPHAADWSLENDAKIAAATEAEVLAAFVADEASAKSLLGQLRGAYETDPLVMIQIAAVTQWVMLPDPCFLWFWKDFPSDGRKVWTAALTRCIAESADPYIRTFCRQQLDLCK